MIISLDRRISHYAPDLSGNSQVRNYFVYHDRSCLIRLFLYIYIYVYIYIQVSLIVLMTLMNHGT